MVNDADTALNSLLGGVRALLLPKSEFQGSSAVLRRCRAIAVISEHDEIPRARF